MYQQRCHAGHISCVLITFFLSLYIGSCFLSLKEITLFLQFKDNKMQLNYVVNAEGQMTFNALWDLFPGYIQQVCLIPVLFLFDPLCASAALGAVNRGAWLWEHVAWSSTGGCSLKSLTVSSTSSCRHPTGPTTGPHPKVMFFLRTHSNVICVRSEWDYRLNCLAQLIGVRGESCSPAAWISGVSGRHGAASWN